VGIYLAYPMYCEGDASLISLFLFGVHCLELLIVDNRELFETFFLEAYPLGTRLFLELKICVSDVHSGATLTAKH
jgi:hypothetical protein